MLGRIPSAATVAALPWAGVLVAATSGSVLWVAIGTLVTLAILLWGLAPHISWLRRLVPAVRQVDQLETFWAQGHELAREWIEVPEELDGWFDRQKAWQDEAADWIEGNISKVEAERFRRPAVSSASYENAFNDVHLRRLRIANSGLSDLLRLRDEKEESLR
jgi:hypothetical protein